MDPKKILRILSWLKVHLPQDVEWLLFQELWDVRGNNGRLLRWSFFHYLEPSTAPILSWKLVHALKADSSQDHFTYRGPSITWSDASDSGGYGKLELKIPASKRPKSISALRRILQIVGCLHHHSYGEYLRSYETPEDQGNVIGIDVSRDFVLHQAGLEKAYFGMCGQDPLQKLYFTKESDVGEASR